MSQNKNQDNKMPLLLNRQEWIKKYNEERKVMASAADIYQAIKTGDDELIKDIQKDLEWGLVLNTTINYKADVWNPENLEGKIIHHHKSIITREIEIDTKIHLFRNTPIERALLVENYYSKTGLRYLQALFGTIDNEKKIIETLRKVSARKKYKRPKPIRLWTASTNGNYTRANNPERGVFMILEKKS